ncbi:hypothetical protein GCM10010508_61690 [Streptomyces naganishii JCM 4654]|uniref:Uncharacterized protein n=1 Tax=Streptomyces naganishii JCM 4654 TaxID=1306179 RepID=A0A918Y9G0_9ACTN|nr:hypothetical protein GCM10010508_61690 [Streptomyces naganishii JCM 4654]
MGLRGRPRDLPDQPWGLRGRLRDLPATNPVPARPPRGTCPTALPTPVLPCPTNPGPPQPTLGLPDQPRGLPDRLRTRPVDPRAPALRVTPGCQVRSGTPSAVLIASR